MDQTSQSQNNPIAVAPTIDKVTLTQSWEALLSEYKTKLAEKKEEGKNK
jgi:hypothetical protein